MSSIAQTKEHDAQAGPASLLSQITVEQALYGLSFIVALGLRLASQEGWPLLDGEASLALAAWRFARGLPTVLRGHGPLLFNLNAFLLYFTDGSDQLIRLGPLCFGSLMVLWPAGLRRRLGRIGALAASFLLSASPTFTYFSRSIDGHIVVAFCALGLLVCTDRYLEQRRGAPLAGAAALLLVSLLAAPSAYTLLVVLLTLPLFLCGWARVRYDGWWGEVRELWNGLDEQAADLRRCMPVLVVLLGLAGLGLSANPASLQMALDQFGQWAGGLRAPGQPLWYAVPFMLVLYESLPLLLGLVGMVLDRECNDLWCVGLRYWFAFMLLVSLVPGFRSGSQLLLLVLPLVLFSARSVDDLWRVAAGVREQAWLWALVAVSGLVDAAIYLQIVNYLSFASPNHLLRMGALAVFLLSAYALVWSLAGAEAPKRAVALSLLLWLVLGSVRTESRLNLVPARDSLEPMVGTTTSADLLRFEQKAARLSSQLAGDPREMTWLVADALEVPLGWYLRAFEQVEYVPNVPDEPDVGAVVTSSDGPAPAGYVGLRFGLRSPAAAMQRSPLEWLRWWTDFQSPAPASASEGIVLWVQPAPQ